MGLPRLVSAAFFGLRDDRDSYSYYRDPLIELVRAYPGEATVFTNEPGQFTGLAASVMEVLDFRDKAIQLWSKPDLDWYASVVGRTKAGRKLVQSTNPGLSLVWLAKTVLALDTAVDSGPVLWIDAGLRNSVFGVGRGRYSSEGLGLVGGECEGVEGGCFATIERKPRVLRGWRRDFHGASRWEMEGLARACGVSATDGSHVVGGMMVLTADVAGQILEEFPAVWMTMLERGVAGTEETVLSVLRWKYGWSSRMLDEWSETIVVSDAND